MQSKLWRKRCLGVASLATLIIFACFYGTLNNSQEEEIARQYNLAALPKNISNLPSIDGSTCQCTNRDTAISHHFQIPSSIVWRRGIRTPWSSCEEASQRGPHQKVVSFSLYGNLTDRYRRGLAENAARISFFYPGWTMRVYHSLDTDDDYQKSSLCDIWCRFPHVDFCSVGRLGGPRQTNFSDIVQCNGMIWRFMVLGDPLVDQFMVRDLDSIIIKREVSAVQSWAKKNVTWHFMHDNPYHNSPIMGGMWGGMNRDLEQNSQLRQILINDGKRYHTKGSDQVLISKYLLDIAKRNNDYLDHSSYLCNDYMTSTPFPTQRADNDFVGSVLELGNFTRVLAQCPVKCRPPEHLDWIFC